MQLSRHRNSESPAVNAFLETRIHGEACYTHARRIAELAEMAVTQSTRETDLPARIGYHEQCLARLGLSQAEIYSWVNRVGPVPQAD